MNRSALFLITSSFFYATGGLLFKYVEWSPLAANSARSLISFCCLYFFYRAQGKKIRFNRSIMLTAVTNVFVTNLYAFANKLTTAGNAIVLQFTMPVFVIIITAIFNKKKPSRLDLITCACVFGGIICFFIDSLSAGNMLGNALAICSGFFFALTYIFNKMEGADPISANMVSYAVSFLIGLPVLFRTDIAAGPKSTVLAVIALGVVQLTGGTIFFSKGIKDTPIVTAALVSGLEPIINPVLVAVFYHEMLTPLSFIGAAIVLISILSYNVILSKRQAEGN